VLCRSECILCDEPLGDEKSTQLLVVALDDQQLRHWHDAEAVRVHEGCLSGMPDALIDLVLDECDPTAPHEKAPRG